MGYFNNILEAIGRTPLVKLNKLTSPEDAEVLVKCEFLNPTGSVKDRIGAYIIERAEKEGKLKPGGTIVENTSGNTGLGLAMTAAVKGYKCVFTMPDKMSQEKINMLKAFGAEVVITPTDVPGDSPDHYVQVAKRIAEETPGAYYVNQYHTPLNIEAHYHSTGPEIWEQTDEGDFDCFVAGTGTGGTISGVGRYLKEKTKDRERKISIVGVDPVGSIHYHYFYHKTLVTPHVYKVEGIGEDILCQALDFSVLDEMHQVTDKECFLTARRLVREEGLFCGGASGGIVHIALKKARELGPGKRVVCLLTDSGNRYITKFLSDAWMKDHGFLEEEPELGFVEDLLARKGNPSVITIQVSAPLKEAIELMGKHGVSQLPVIDRDNRLCGIVREIDILRAFHDGKATVDSSVEEVAKEVNAIVSPKTRLEELYTVFDTEQVAVVVDAQKIVGIVAKIDLIEFLASKKN